MSPIFRIDHVQLASTCLWPISLYVKHEESYGGAGKAEIEGRVGAVHVCNGVIYTDEMKLQVGSGVDWRRKVRRPPGRDMVYIPK